ncbi:hypothetical protein CCONF_02370 [Corynebacterium confusum]|nr:hypothetical protein CCONF_02370 [Corynebacterium confusum]
MILSLTGAWSINPLGPLRESEDAEDLWSLVNATVSIMSGTPLSPWFVGESNDSEIRGNGELDTLVLEVYAADKDSGSAVSYLPSIMLAIKISLEKAYKPAALSRVALDSHPGEYPASTPAPWWGNFFNRIEGNESWDLTVSPFSSGLARKASTVLPYLFRAEGQDLTSTSWGLMEAAALISVFAEENARWKKIVIDSQKTILD